MVCTGQITAGQAQNSLGERPIVFDHQVESERGILLSFGETASVVSIRLCLPAIPKVAIGDI